MTRQLLQSLSTEELRDYIKAAYRPIKRKKKSILVDTTIILHSQRCP